MQDYDAEVTRVVFNLADLDEEFELDVPSEEDTSYEEHEEADAIPAGIDHDYRLVEEAAASQVHETAGRLN